MRLIICMDEAHKHTHKHTQTNMATLSHQDFPEFMQAIKEAPERLFYSHNKNFIVWQLAKIALGREGDFAEVGVYKGGTAFLIINARGNDISKRVFLFDTFSGIPYSDERDLHKQGDYQDVSFAEIIKFFERFANVFLVQGIFPSSAIQLKISIDKFAFVHLDVDVYKSYHDCLSFFYPKLSNGGIILVDDYGALSCPGAKQAIDDFIKQREEAILYIETGQAIIFKKHN